MRKEDAHLFPPHFWKTIVVSLVFFIVVPVGIYLASYIPYIKPEQPKSLKTLVEVCWDNQKTMLSYHSGLNTDKVTTPTEGVLVDIWQSVGSTVKEGDVLGIVKEGPTDHQIRADQDGRIIKVNKKIRATVSAGETLFVMRVGGHPFESKWYQWLVDVRPVFYFISTYPEEIGDTTVNMRASSSTFNSPIVSWGGLIALLSMVGLLLYWKKHIAWFILIGYFSQLVPWLGISRTTYAYHYFPSVVFLVLAICCIFDTWMERDSQLVTRIHIGAWKLPTAKRMILIFTCVTVGIFVLFYPVLAALPVPEWFISDFLRWFPSWPI
jgi:biotin carboxyl carrier protein